MEQDKPKSFFKKYWKEIIFIFLSVLIFLGLIYFLFFKSRSGPNNSNSDTNKGLLGFNFKDLFNFTKNGSTNSNQNSTTTNSNGHQTIPNFSPYYVESLIQVWDEPVAGYGLYQKDNHSILQFVDSKTGYIYEKDLSEPTSTPTQITNTTYSNVGRAYFLNNSDSSKNRVFLQYFKNNNLKTITADIPSSSGPLKNVDNLPDNISYISTSPDSQKLVYVVQKTTTTSDNFQDLTSDWYKIDKPTEIYGDRFYQSLFGYWKLIILNTGQVYAYTTDTYFESTNLYKVNTEASTSETTLEYIYGDHKGMSFLINSDSLVASIATASGQQVYHNNFSGGSLVDSDLTPFTFQTLSNKCTQNDSGGSNLIICSVPKQITNYDYGLPDAWYQGMTSWDDNLYIINSKYPSGQLLYDFKNDGNVSQAMDSKNLQINQTKDHLIFINKNDGSLWTLNIQNILTVSAD